MITAYYDRAFQAAKSSGCAPAEAVARVAEMYVDGKPKRLGRKRLSQADRDEAFFSWRVLGEVPAHAWLDDYLVLSLAQYVAQDRSAAPGLLRHVAKVAPEEAKRAIRLSGLVLKPASPRRAEVAQLTRIASADFGQFVQTLEVFFDAHRDRKDQVSRLREPFVDLSVIEVMAYASLYAFKHLVADGNRDPHRSQTAWSAVSSQLEWKLAMSTDDSFNMTDDAIADSFAAHVSPFLFPTDREPPRSDLLRAFEALMDAQIELDEFVERSANAFSYDHSIDFVPTAGGLEIVELDARARALSAERWERENERIERLHRYWSVRGMAAFFDAGLAQAVIGRPDNAELNRVAYIKALAAELLLVNVFGAGNNVSTESGRKAPLFKALLAMELSAAFYEAEFVIPYLRHLEHAGAWDLALTSLALDGISTGENRFPLTWSRRDEKARRITGWTVDAEHPKGSRRDAEAILDLWTADCRSLARRIGSAKSGLMPELYERPFLKLGRYLFQLPWLTAFLNTRVAAVNNLRRLGARREETRGETARIEQRLADMFRQRGFDVLLNHTPTSTDGVGEVDLVCGRDGSILLLEVKSTFVRKSASEAWLHGARTLRRAGRQLKRKLAVATQDPSLSNALGIDPGQGATRICAWIVDTSLEHDHERFSGFLKVSLEELIIALRDDKHLLMEADRVFEEDTEPQTTVPDLGSGSTLYPGGFSFDAFVHAIESESVWST